jgi:hypothetical protein
MKQLPFITIVSGLPRSGTSMMMQVIEAGGVPALTDNLRTRDEDNPQGYYEYEPVKKTREDPSWVPGARGKVVKMVYRLLYDLPGDQEYRVIFMRRNIDEVLTSQKKMLQRSGKQGAAISDERLKELFMAELDKFDRWIAVQKNFSLIPVDYSEMVQSPGAQCKRINEFLGGVLDCDRAAAAVDPSLYRNRG